MGDPRERGRDEAPRTKTPRTVDELITRYLEHCALYYRRLPDREGNRPPTRQHLNIASSLQYARELWAERDPETLTADDVDEVRQCMPLRRKRNGDRLTREYINRAVGHIRRCFRWAAAPPQRWVSRDVLLELDLLPPLRFARSEAREPEDVAPVAEVDFRATLAAIAAIGEDPERSEWALQLGVMLDLAWATGMRPGELVDLHRDDLSIERTPARPGSPAKEILVYRPLQHKGRHFRLPRVIFVAPEGRRVIADWSERVQPDGRFWTLKTVSGYRQAIIRVQQEFDLARWTPNQIRHSFATRMRASSGLDIVQVLCGHKHRSTSEIYALPDARAAIDALLLHG